MKIAVWYHCVITGERIPQTDTPVNILCEQMHALEASGLAAAADEIHIGVNGAESDTLLVAALSPEKAKVEFNPGGKTELATLRRLRGWLKPGWAVLYHHSKAAQHDASNVFYHEWRRRMERACVWNWRPCVEALRQGYHTAGNQWTVPFDGPTFPPGQRYWAGNFWWATSEHLLSLGPLVEPQYEQRDEFENRYEAEVWIGKSPYAPRCKSIAA